MKDGGVRSQKRYWPVCKEKTLFIYKDEDDGFFAHSVEIKLWESHCS